ncbi:MAG: tetratricopeptide repeat protein [Bacteroidales bacterium]|nr:tetratricopeptide repeat protein [Bacteroidales bacterium]
MNKTRIVAALGLLLLLAGCSPQVYSLYLDVRQPSQSGLDLARKSLCILYPEGRNQRDSLFDRQAVSAMARLLESDYFGGEEKIGLYSIPTPDSVSVELMRSLVMDTEYDVVFLLSSTLGETALETNQPVSGATSADSSFVCPANIPISTQLSVYDSMGEDKVQRFRGKAVMRPVVYNSGVTSDDGLKYLALQSLGPEAQKMGYRIASRFLSQWKTESFSFYYCEDLNNMEWTQALAYASRQQFSKAIDIWASLLKGSVVKKAAASYNIAMAFYLLEDFEMADLWLKQADQLENLSLSPGLRKRINTHLEKLQK